MVNIIVLFFSPRVSPCIADLFDQSPNTAFPLAPLWGGDLKIARRAISLSLRTCGRKEQGHPCLVYRSETQRAQVWVKHGPQTLDNEPALPTPTNSVVWYFAHLMVQRGNPQMLDVLSDFPPKQQKHGQNMTSVPKPSSHGTSPAVSKSRLWFPRMGWDYLRSGQTLHRTGPLLLRTFLV